MRGLALLAVLSQLGCGLLVDTAYWLDDGKKITSHTESRPTGQTLTAIEMDAALADDGRLALTCESRTRSVELTWDVHKEWRYRGGFEPDVYMGMTIVDGIFGAVTLIAIGAACAQDDLDFSCWNLLWASPWALDLGWSVYRWQTAKPPKLVDKRNTASRPQVGRVLESQKLDCPVTQVFVGHARGYGREEELRGWTGGEPRQIDEGAVVLPVEGGFADPAKHPEVLEMLANSYSSGIWYQEPEGEVMGARFDRCQILRKHLEVLEPETRTKVEQQCPLAPPPAATTAQ